MHNFSFKNISEVTSLYKMFRKPEVGIACARWQEMKPS